MGEINISNSAGRDAVVNTESVTSKIKVRWVDDQGRQAMNARLIKATINHDIDALTEKTDGLAGVADALLDGNPDGSERDRRPREVPPPNVAAEVPLKWSGVMIKKEDAVRKFVFSSKMQMHHINGLTYDFLYAMAKELEEKKSLMLLGAGPKSNQPLILRRGSTPYRGFLEGRTDGDKYILILHLSNLELKAPAPLPGVEGDE
jgi:hypothetical protein